MDKNGFISFYQRITFEYVLKVLKLVINTNTFDQTSIRIVFRMK